MMSDYMNIPTIDIDLKGVKASIKHAFNQHNDELNKLIQLKLDQTLSQEWVSHMIGLKVEEAVRNAIGNLTNDYRLRRTITSAIVDQIQRGFKPDVKFEGNDDE